MNSTKGQTHPGRCCIFYDLQHSNNAARIRLWLRFKGLLREDDCKNNTGVKRHLLSMADLQSPDFAKINPCRKVPALVTDTGMALFEASVIMNYLEDVFTGIKPSLVLDTSPEDRAFVQLLVRCHDLYISSPNCNQPNFSHTQGCMYLDPTPTEFTPDRRTMNAATRAAKLQELYEQLLWLEGQLRLPYMAGSQMTHADLTWFPTIVFMEFMLPKSFGWSESIFHEHDHFPKLTQWYEYCLNTTLGGDQAQHQHPFFEQVREEILVDHRAQYTKGRLSGVKEDVKNHPGFKWKYI